MSKSKVTIEQLFELGAHFGHRKRFWNPHMEEYIFCEKNNIHIIDLYKTQEKILELYEAFKNFSSLGNKIMIVGTKRVASEYVKDFGEKTGMPYISHRWLGGMLTNWKTIKIPINKLLEYEENKSSGQLEGMIKKEAVMLEKEMKKLSLNFDGVKDMKGLPDAPQPKSQQPKKQPQPKSQQPKKQPQPKSQQPKKQPQPKSQQPAASKKPAAKAAAAASSHNQPAAKKQQKAGSQKNLHCSQQHCKQQQQF